MNEHPDRVPGVVTFLKWTLTIIGTLALMGIGISAKVQWDQEIRVTRLEDDSIENAKIKAEARTARRIADIQQKELEILSTTLSRIQNNHWTEKDATIQRDEIEDMLIMLIRNLEIPPGPLKSRVRSLEKLHEKDGYTPPTEEWN